MTVTTTASHRRELMRLLKAIRDATAAITGQPDTPAVAQWLAHRAVCYRTIAAAHPDDCAYPHELAEAAAALDEAHAQRIERGT